MLTTDLCLVGTVPVAVGAMVAVATTVAMVAAADTACVSVWIW